MERSLQTELQARLEATGSQPVLGFVDRRCTTTWKTWPELHIAVTARARWLADHGVRQGDICPLVLRSDDICATLVLSTLWLGALPLLMAPPMLREGHAHLKRIVGGVLRQTKARVAICSHASVGTLRELEAEGYGTRVLAADTDIDEDDSDVLQPIATREEDVAALQLTSGTTGFPRICVWKQKQVLAALDAMEQSMDLSPEDICFNWTPLYHDMGLVNNFLLCLCKGVPLALLGPEDFVKKPVLWLDGLSRTRSTITWSPNFGYALATQRIQDQELEGVRLDRVRTFWNAAERIHDETIRAFAKRFGPYGVAFKDMRTNFGCAENVGGATLSGADRGVVFERLDRRILHEEGRAQPLAASNRGDEDAITVVSTGKPAPGIRISILSRHSKVLPDGFVGEVALDTPSRMEGYLGDASTTHRVVLGNLVRTGDLGYLRNGELFWTGRARERINVRGKKVDPSDLEPILFAVDGLRQGCFVAFGVDDSEEGTQRLVIVCEVRTTDREALRRIVQEVRERVFVELDLVASEVILVAAGSLPKTSSGKRRHRHFKEAYLATRMKEANVLHHHSGTLGDPCA